MSKKEKPNHITNEDFNNIIPQILHSYSLFIGQDEETLYNNINNYFKHLNEKNGEFIQQRQNDETQKESI